MNKFKILIIEDEEDLRNICCELLIAAGYDVTPASDGLEALQLLQNKNYKPDLIVTDLRMSPMGGQQFLEVKAQCAHLVEIPVIVMSAEKLTAKFNDVVAVCEKPFEIGKLLNHIEIALKYDEQRAQA